jgi:hypothetical protein
MTGSTETERREGRAETRGKRQKDDCIQRAIVEKSFEMGDFGREGREDRR